MISLNVSVEGTESYEIVCKFKGRPQTTVQWINGNSTVVTQDRIKTVAKEDFYTSTLMLEDIRTTRYACKVHNSLKEDLLEGFIYLPNPRFPTTNLVPSTHSSNLLTSSNIIFSSSQYFVTSYMIYIFSAFSLYFCL